MDDIERELLRNQTVILTLLRMIIDSISSGIIPDLGKMAIDERIKATMKMLDGGQDEIRDDTDV